MLSNTELLPLDGTLSTKIALRDYVKVHLRAALPKEYHQLMEHDQLRTVEDAMTELCWAVQELAFTRGVMSVRRKLNEAIGL